MRLGLNRNSSTKKQKVSKKISPTRSQNVPAIEYELTPTRLAIKQDSSTLQQRQKQKRKSESLTLAKEAGAQGDSLKGGANILYSSETYGQYGFKNINLIDAKLEVGEVRLSMGDESMRSKSKDAAKLSVAAVQRLKELQQSRRNQSSATEDMFATKFKENSHEISLNLVGISSRNNHKAEQSTTTNTFNRVKNTDQNHLYYSNVSNTENTKRLKTSTLSKRNRLHN